MSADPTKCPDCAGPLLPPANDCAACGLPLTGPLAQRLWELDVELDRLAEERRRVLGALRQSPPVPAPGRAAPTRPAGDLFPAAPTRPADLFPAAPARAAAVPTAIPGVPTRTPGAPPFGAPAAGAPRPPAPAPAPAPGWALPGAPAPAPRKPRAEWTPQRVQNLLLGLGVLLLAVAAVFFTAVAWGRFGVTGRAAIMAGVTGGTAFTGRLAYRRGLTATAEAVAALTVVLLLVDAYAVRRIGVAGLDGVGGSTFWAWAVGAVALLSGGYGRVVPVRSARWAAVAGIQVPLAVRVLDTHLAYGTQGAILAVQAGLVVALAPLVPKLPRDARDVARATGAATALGALVLAVADAVGPAPTAGALGLAVLGAGAALTAWTGRDDRDVRVYGSGAATVLLLGAAAALGREQTDATRYPLVLAASGLLAVVAAATLPRLWRTAPMVVGAANVAVSVTLVAEHVVTAVAGPFAWLADPWRAAGGDAARAVLTPDAAWGGSVVTLVVLLAAVATTLVVSENAGRREVTAVPVAVAVALAALLVPLGQAWAYGPAVAWDVAAGGVLAALAYAARGRRPHLANALYASALVALTVGTAWSLAGETATVLALPAVALVLAASARFDAPPAAVSAALATAAGTGWVYALAVGRGAPVDRAGFLLAVAGAAGTAAVVGRAGAVAVSVAVVGAAAYAVGTLVTAGDPGWLGWACGVGALAAGYGAVRLRAAEPPLAGLATALACGWTAGFAASHGVAAPRVGFLVAATAAVAAAVGVLLAGRRETAVALAGTATLAYAVGLLVAAPDAGALGWTLALGTAAAAFGAVRVREAEAPLAGVAAALGCAATAALTASRGVDAEQVGLVTAGAAGVVALVATLLADRRATATALAGVAVCAYLPAVAVASPDRARLAWALAVGALVAAFAATRVRDLEPPLAGVAAGLTCAWTGAFAAGRGVPADRTGFLVALTGLGLAVLGGVLGARQSTAVALAGVGGAGWAVGTLAAAGDPGWLSWSLAAAAGTAAWLGYRVRSLEAPLAGAAAALACGWSAAFAASRGVPVGRVGFLVAVTAVLAAGAAALLARRERTSLALDGVAATGYAAGLLATVPSVGWLSWTLALGGCAALAVALRPDRRPVAWVGSALLSGFSWARLGIEEVRAPEAYAAAPAGIALVLGHLRHRADERVSSWAAYGPGLSLALLPSLAASVADTGLARPLLLGGVALVVVLLGARERLQAPLVLGGLTLAVDALDQLGPYAVQLPRWVALAAAGTLLVALGATYEQRRRDLDRLRDRFEAMS